jgi:hypothetical protein
MSIGSKIIDHTRRGDLLEVTSRRLVKAWHGDVRRRRLVHSPGEVAGTDSSRRINRLLQLTPGPRRYLEVGLDHGFTLEAVDAAVRWGVDPYPAFNIKHLPAGVHIAQMTSDDFFATLGRESTFDAIFVDGLHTFRQAYRDVINACRACPNGAILVDDVVPCDEISAMPNSSESMQERVRQGVQHRMWHGDVYRAMLCIAEHHPEISFRTIIDAGNPQALVWLHDPDTPVTCVAQDVLDEYESRAFADVFKDGVPNILTPTSEGQALSEWSARRNPGEAVQVEADPN